MSYTDFQRLLIGFAFCSSFVQERDRKSGIFCHHRRKKIEHQTKTLGRNRRGNGVLSGL